MAAEKGISFKIKKGTAVICAGIMSKKVKYGGEPIDITSDDDNGYRTFLFAESGTKSIDVSIEAVMKDKVLFMLIINDERMLTDVYLEFSNGDKITGDFYLSNYNEDYTHDAAVKFSADLLSSGPYVFDSAL